MKDQELVNALRTHSEAARKIGLYQGKSGIWAVIEQASDRIANQDTHILALQKEIEKLRGQLPRWIPVEERRPEYNARVLVIDVYAGEGDEFIAIWTREEYPDDPEDGCWIDDRGWWHAFDEVTHWMPLLEPPKEER